MSFSPEGFTDKHNGFLIWMQTRCISTPFHLPLSLATLGTFPSSLPVARDGWRG